MIRYAIDAADLDARITAASRSWFDVARRKTAKFDAANSFNEDSGVWSRIKRVFMELQHFKCGFCERRLERSAYGNIEHDVEHFRPKKRVDEWPSANAARLRGIDLAYELGDDLSPAYHLLAYERFNYLVSCKTCNSTLKANNFPAAATLTPDVTDLVALRDEQPYLIYPIGDIDADDPEDLIGFTGTAPQIKPTDQHRRRRAEVTIELFELDTREILLRERSEILLGMFIAHGSRRSRRRELRAAANLALARAILPESPHTNCARNYLRTLDADPDLAERLAREAREYLLNL